jgi:hypothetical protein
VTSTTRRLVFGLLLALALAAEVAACDLNPQPLPPADKENSAAPPFPSASSSGYVGGDYRIADAAAASATSDSGTPPKEQGGPYPPAPNANDGGDEGGVDAGADADAGS